MPKVTCIDHTCKCGFRFRSVCKYQWQIDYAKKNAHANVCDWCATGGATANGIDRYDARDQFNLTAKELEQQMEADLKCLNI